MIVVQVGTNDGNDHVWNLCKTHTPSFVLLVEPFPVHRPSIERRYAGIPYTLESSAIICGSDTSITLYYHDLDGPNGHPNHKFEVTSMVPDHLLKHGYPRSQLKDIEVPAMTLNALLDKYALTTIDYLFLDVEGIDFDVLKSLDFDRYDIKNLQIEHIHLDKMELNAFMIEKGYRPLDKSLDPCGYDTLFRKICTS